MDTTHMSAMGFWAQMPLPIAELGVRLDPRGKEYLDQLLRVLDAGLRVGLAIGLARASAVGAKSSLYESLLPLLVNPTLGKRAQAIAVLERAVPGTTGWNLDRREDELTRLAEALDGKPRRRSPKLRESLEQLAKVRNDEKHWSLTQKRSAELRGPLEDATLCLLRSNTELARGHMMILNSVRRTKPGEVECRAWSLRGATCSVLQQRSPLRLRDDESFVEGRVFWRRDEETILPLSPFVVAPLSEDNREPAIDQGVYVLDSIERHSVVRRRPRTSEVFDPGDEADLDTHLPGWRDAHARGVGRPTQADTPGPATPVSGSRSQNVWDVAEFEAPLFERVPSEPPVLLPRPRLPMPWLAAAVGAVFLAAAAVAGWWWMSGEPSGGAVVASSDETQRAAATRNCPARWTWLAGVSNPACWQTFEATWRDVRACADCPVPTRETRLMELSRRAELCTDGEDEPANCLPPGSAERVCRALGLRDFGVGTGRLPTAAEWKNAAQWPDLDAPSLVLARANEGAFNLCDSTFVAAFPSERCVRPTLLDGGARVDPQHQDRWARVAPGGRFPADRVNGLFDVYGNVSEFVSLGGDRWGAGGRSFLSGIAERSGALVVGPQSRNQLTEEDFGAQYGFRCIVPLAP